MEKSKISAKKDAASEKRPSRFDEIVSTLPEEYAREIIATDAFLKSLRPLKFKRTITKYGDKITYVASDAGFSYAFRVGKEEGFSQEFSWYVVHNGLAETWHRRADFMEDMLNEIKKIDPRLSDRIYGALIGCRDCYGDRCLAKTVYSYNGQSKVTCHGCVKLTISANDFDDARRFIGYLNDYVAKREADGAPPPEKIILIHTKRTL